MTRLLLVYTLVLWALQLAGGLLARWSPDRPLWAVAAALVYAALTGWVGYRSGQVLAAWQSRYPLLPALILLLLWLVPGAILPGWAALSPTPPLQAAQALAAVLGMAAGFGSGRAARPPDPPRSLPQAAVPPQSPGDAGIEGTDGSTDGTDSSSRFSPPAWQPARRAADVIERAKSSGGRRRRAR